MKKEDFLVRIVDDDPNQRDGLELVLSLRGWKSKAYPDGTTFLNEDNFLTPGCVILPSLIVIFGPKPGQL